MHLQSQLGNKGRKKSKACTHALLEGYSCVGRLSDDDINQVPYMILTRKLAMIGWLYARRDNPRLLEYFQKKIKADIRELGNVLAHGPSPIL